MIVIRIEGLGYFAKATPPHVTREWANIDPLSRNDIVKALGVQGAHVQDSWDAVFEAEKLIRPIGDTHLSSGDTD